MDGPTIALLVTAVGGFIAGCAALWKSWSDRDATQGTVAQAQVDSALHSLGAAMLRLEKENADLHRENAKLEGKLTAASAAIAALQRRVGELERELTR